jgi:hypothetical protein
MTSDKPCRPRLSYCCCNNRPGAPTCIAQENGKALQFADKAFLDLSDGAFSKGLQSGVLMYVLR